MAYRVGQRNFSKGVLSKELWSRSDIAPYSAGLREGTNVVILKYGGVTKRPGTRYVYEVRDGDKKLFPFEGAYNVSYALLMGQASMRLGALGGMVIEQQLTIEEIVLDDPIRIKASFHGYTTGDEVFFQGIEGPEDLNGQILTVTVIDADHFSVPITGAGLSPLISDTGGVIRTEAPAEPVPAPTVPDPEPAPTLPDIGGGTGTLRDTEIVIGGGTSGRGVHYL